MNNISLMLSWLNSDDKIAAQHGSADWGYKKLPAPPTHTMYLRLFGCKYCGCVVWADADQAALMDATTNMLVVHAVHCTGVSLGVRVVRAKKYREDRENAVWF